MPSIRESNIVSEAQIRALAAEGHTTVRMAEILGVNLGMLRAGMSLMGIKSGRPYGGGGNAVKAKKSLELLLAGCTLQEIADTRGVSRQAIYCELKRANLPTTCRAAIAAKRKAEVMNAPIDIEHYPA